MLGETLCSFCLIWCGVNECLLSVLRKNVTTDLVTRYIKIEPEVQVKNWGNWISNTKLCYYIYNSGRFYQVTYLITFSTQFVIILEVLLEKDDPFCLPEWVISLSILTQNRLGLLYENSCISRSKRIWGQGSHFCEVISCCSRVRIVNGLLC